MAEPIRVEMPPETPRLRQPGPGEVLRTIKGRVYSVSDLLPNIRAGKVYVSATYGTPSIAVGWWAEPGDAPVPGTPVEVWIVVPEEEA